MALRNTSIGAEPVLQRRLSLTLLTLYGLGVTVGAGIYVLIGLTAAKAGPYVPVSFLLAAMCVAFSGFTYAELSTRYPVSAGEAAYVRHAFHAPRLATTVGLTVAIIGVVSSATIAIGASAYLAQFIPLSETALTCIIVLVLGLAAAWGILESTTIAAVFTVIEIGGLAGVIVYGVTANPDILVDMARLIPPLELGVWGGIASGALLAFFAFVGFEDLANVAEEVKQPNKTMPRAIIYTLAISTVIYLVVTSVVVLSVPIEQLSQSAAPLSLIFGADDPLARGTLNLIAGVATLNGVLIQMIMASRVLYGLADQGSLHSSIAYIDPRTRTPLIATALVVFAIGALAILTPIERLATATSVFVLVVFALVNLSLVRLKLLGAAKLEHVYEVPIWVPVMGCLTCLLLLAASML